MGENDGLRPEFSSSFSEEQEVEMTVNRIQHMKLIAHENLERRRE